MKEFTKGPWKAEVNEKSANVSILGRRADGDNRSSDGFGYLVYVDCAAEPDAVLFSPMLPEQVANARLIAEAPEMYRLLDWLRHYAAMQVKYHPDALDSPMWRDMLAVLKRIDGEDQ